MTLETEEEVHSNENKLSDYGVFLVFFSFLQIVSHSRSQDGTWLNPENLRQILSGLEACPAGQYPCGFVCVCPQRAQRRVMRLIRFLSFGFVALFFHLGGVPFHDVAAPLQYPVQYYV